MSKVSKVLLVVLLGMFMVVGNAYAIIGLPDLFFDSLTTVDYNGGVLTLDGPKSATQYVSFGDPGDPYYIDHTQNDDVFIQAQFSHQVGNKWYFTTGPNPLDIDIFGWILGTPPITDPQTGTLIRGNVLSLVLTPYNANTAILSGNFDYLPGTGCLDSFYAGFGNKGIMLVTLESLVGYDPTNPCQNFTGEGAKGDIAPPIPEPGSMLLFGTGLIGLIGIGRRRFFG